MKITRRELINLAMVAVLAVAAVGWSAFNLVGISFHKPKTVRVRLATSGGALPGAEVTYLGVPVGKVQAARLVPHAVELRLSVRPKGPMAKVMRADVMQKSSLGEPQIELSPADPKHAEAGDPDGTLIPVERTRTPRPLHELLGRTEQVLAKLRPQDLAAISQGFSGVVGHEDDIRQLMASWADVGQVVGQRHAELGGLISESAKLTAALDAHRDDLANAVSGYAGLGRVLAKHTGDLTRILEQGARLGHEGSDLLTTAHDDLRDVLAGLDVTFHNLATRPQKVRETLYWMPEFMQKISYVLEGDAMNVAVGQSLIPIVPGYQPSLAIPVYGEGLRLDKILVPGLAQRVDLDLQGERKGQTVAYLSPAESRFALSSMQNLLAMIRQKQAELDAGKLNPNP